MEISNKIKKYTFGFDATALILFLAIMIPNIIWFVFPADNDILRKESVTPIIDMIASVMQVLMIASLVLIKNKDFQKLRISPLTVSVVIFCLLYFLAWIFYYQGVVNSIVLICLAVAPCMAYLFYAIYRKNMAAVVPAVVFTVCHLSFALFNFVL